MAVWNSVFLHEFLDGNLANLQALPGDLTVRPNHPVVNPTPDPERRGFVVQHGRVLGYHFQRAIENVIGVDLSVDLVDLVLPGPQTTVEFLTILSLRDGQEGQVGLGIPIVHSDSFPSASFGVGDGGMGFDLRFVPSQTLRLRVRWHTHGQVQVWQDGVLRAYEPGLAAGRALRIDRLAAGSPQGHGVGNVRMRRVYVKLLRRDDSRNELRKQVTIDTSMLPRTPCATTASALLADLLAQIRKFMTEFISKTTTSWREGQPQGPFSREAIIAAHQAAVAAGEAFVAFHTTREETGAADTFLKQIGTLLDILAAADPPRYAALLEELTALDNTFEECRGQLQPLYEANTQTLDPLARLLRETWDRAKTALPGGSHA